MTEGMADWTDRHKAAALLPEALREAGLVPDAGPVRDGQGRFWSARWRTGGESGAYGEVRVYGTDYFCCIWHDAPPSLGIDQGGSRIFDDAGKAASFLGLLFVSGWPDMAFSIAVRQRKERLPKALPPEGMPKALPLDDIGPGFFGDGN